MNLRIYHCCTAYGHACRSAASAACDITLAHTLSLFPTHSHTHTHIYIYIYIYSLFLPAVAIPSSMGSGTMTTDTPTPAPTTILTYVV